MKTICTSNAKLSCCGCLLYIPACAAWIYSCIMFWIYPIFCGGMILLFASMYYCLCCSDRIADINDNYVEKRKNKEKKKKEEEEAKRQRNEAIWRQRYEREMAENLIDDPNLESGVAKEEIDDNDNTDNGNIEYVIEVEPTKGDEFTV